jgi:hypothetical protein
MGQLCVQNVKAKKNPELSFSLFFLSLTDVPANGVRKVSSYLSKERVLMSITKNYFPNVHYHLDG